MFESDEPVAGLPLLVGELAVGGGEKLFIAGDRWLSLMQLVLCGGFEKEGGSGIWRKRSTPLERLQAGGRIVVL